MNILDKIICGRLIFPFCKKIISWDREIERYIQEVQSKKIADKSVIVGFHGSDGALVDSVGLICKKLETKNEK